MCEKSRAHVQRYLGADFLGHRLNTLFAESVTEAPGPGYYLKFVNLLSLKPAVNQDWRGIRTTRKLSSESKEALDVRFYGWIPLLGSPSGEQ